MTRACVLGLAAALLMSAAESSDVAGVWRGDSLCTTAAACHDESVVYYIREVPQRTDLVEIRADKIVDGKAITMGTGHWQYDRGRHTLEWRMPRQVWLLRMTGDRIEGTLTLADHTVVRKMTLRKDQ